MEKIKRLLIATYNNGKVKEIKNLLEGCSIPLVSLNELGKNFKLREDGKTFSDNAFKKAEVVSKHYPYDYVVAEDSGLLVNYLKGAPGIRSKRYSGRGASDNSNNRKLLKAMQRAGKKLRKAKYLCCVVLVKNGRLVKSFTGVLQGSIAKESFGENGFGYDPVFYIPGCKKTAAQISLEQKNKISHRAKAFLKLRKYLEKIFF